MKNIFIFLLLNFFVAGNLFAQKEDRNWVFGDSVRIDFNNLSNPICQNIKCENAEVNANISDKNGNLLMYANSNLFASGASPWHCQIMNQQNEVMENGDSIISDYSATNGLLFIPIPNDSEKYYLFSIGLLQGSSQCKLYYSIIDISFNGGLGKVISKNNLMIGDSLTEHLIAIKHGNGRDWWLIARKLNSNSVIKFLISPYGISSPTFQNIGSFYFRTEGECCESRAGNKIAFVSNYGNMDVFDFDRCNGNISNWIELGIPPYDAPNISGWQYYGCEFSPDGNRFFVSRVVPTFPRKTNIFQFTLSSPNPLTTQADVLATTTGFNLGQLEIGPDENIYSVGTQGPGTLDSSYEYLSIIHNPNDSGSFSNLSLFAFYLNGNKTMVGLPNMPNYNLGALEGSACDTLGLGINHVKKNSNSDFNISPNPTNGNFTITTSITIQQIEVINLLGEKVYSLRCNTPTQTLHLTTLSKGVYFIRLKTADGLVMKKVVVE